jgi:hypothetical protein
MMQKRKQGKQKSTEMKMSVEIKNSATSFSNKLQFPTATWVICKLTATFTTFLKNHR